MTKFLTPPAFKGWSFRNFVTPISRRKLGRWGYQKVKEFGRLVEPFRQNTEPWRTDRQTLCDINCGAASLGWLKLWSIQEERVWCLYRAFVCSVMLRIVWPFRPIIAPMTSLGTSILDNTGHLPRHVTVYDYTACLSPGKHAPFGAIICTALHWRLQ